MKNFYLQEDVVTIAKQLLGKQIFTCFNGILTGGIIIETEAYAGINDRASHSFNGKRTPRNESMYKEGGIAYVYLCYGIHHLLNVVTNKKDVPQGVLIRAIHPTHGIEEIVKRRKHKKPLISGPGTVTEALGVTLANNGQSLTSLTLWIEEGIKPKKITVSPRIGVEYAKEDALLPYRFCCQITPKK